VGRLAERGTERGPKRPVRQGMTKEINN
jgi:hypothetical protein